MSHVWELASQLFHEGTNTNSENDWAYFMPRQKMERFVCVCKLYNDKMLISDVRVLLQLSVMEVS